MRFPWNYYDGCGVRLKIKQKLPQLPIIPTTTTVTITEVATRTADSN